MNQFSRSINAELPDNAKPLVLTAKQKETLRYLHRDVKGTYLQLTALLDELDILNRK